jgi:Zn finger protein HypA/HybF involved in hydrogenase expression
MAIQATFVVVERLERRLRVERKEHRREVSDLRIELGQLQRAKEDIEKLLEVSHRRVLDMNAKMMEPPIRMLLWCPECCARHVDVELATTPHHTHACQECGMVWRPAVVATVGVRFLPGYKDGPEKQ